MPAPANLQRRNLIQTAALSSLLVACGQSTVDPVEVDPKDPTASNLGYVKDAKTVDTARFQSYQQGQICANCKLLVGKPEGELMRCTLFPGRKVRSAGWCAAWVQMG